MSTLPKPNMEYASVSLSKAEAHELRKALRKKFKSINSDEELLAHIANCYASHGWRVIKLDAGNSAAANSSLSSLGAWSVTTSVSVTLEREKGGSPTPSDWKQVIGVKGGPILGYRLTGKENFLPKSKAEVFAALVVIFLFGYCATYSSRNSEIDKPRETSSPHQTSAVHSSASQKVEVSSGKDQVIDLESGHSFKNGELYEIVSDQGDRLEVKVENGKRAFLPKKYVKLQ